MNIDIHISNQDIAKLAQMIAKQLAEQMPQQQPKQPTYPATTEAEVVGDQN